MTTVKAKKKLSDVTFEHEGAHIALVSKNQGGPANGHDYSLIMKANKFSPEAIQKMQSVRVTLELPEFLEKFFYVYGSNAEILARMMGWMPDETDDEEEDEDYWEKEYQDYIEEKLASFEIMKSVHDGNQTVLAELDEKRYLKLLRDQALVEKAFRKIDRENKKKETEAQATGGSTEAVEKSVEKGEVEPSKTQENKKMEQVEELQKALKDQQELLEKALAQVAEFETQRKDALIKSKSAQITALVQDETVSAIIVKAALALETDTDFDAFVGAVKKLTEQVEKSGLFREAGVTASEKKTEEGDQSVMNLLKAKYNNKQA